MGGKDLDIMISKQNGNINSIALVPIDFEIIQGHMLQRIPYLHRRLSLLPIGLVRWDSTPSPCEPSGCS